MAINTYQQLNLKNKLSRREEQRQNHGYGEHLDVCQMGWGCGRRGEGIKKYKQVVTEQTQGYKLQEMEQPENLHAGPMGMNNGVWIA